MKNERICFAVDLKDDPEVIARYKHLHRPGGPPAGASRAIRAAGIVVLEIYLIGNRLFMILEAEPGFTPASKDASDAGEADAQRWNALMEMMQVTLPFATEAESFGKWRRLEHIYSLAAQP